MKVPLRFQLTETDCGATALLNAIGYLYEREEILSELENVIYEYTLDSVTKGSRAGSGGVNRIAMGILSHWLTVHSDVNGFPMSVKRYTGEDVTPEKVVRSLHKNSALVVRVWQETVHYVLVTKVDREYVYLFDSYYLDSSYYDEDKEVEIVHDQPFSYNRKVKLKRFFSQTKKDFALGAYAGRELVVVSRTR